MRDPGALVVRAQLAAEVVVLQKRAHQGEGFQVRVLVALGQEIMGVALALGRDVDEAKRKAIQTASQVRVQL